MSPSSGSAETSSPGCAIVLPEANPNRFYRVRRRGTASDSVPTGPKPRAAGSARPAPDPCALILRSAGVDVLVPEGDPAGHALHVLEARLAERLGELHRAAAALAVDDDLSVAVLLEPVGVLVQLLERDQLGAVDVRDLVLVGEPAVDEVEILVPVEHLLHLARRHLPVRLVGVTGRESAGVETRVGFGLRHALFVSAR